MSDDIWEELGLTRQMLHEAAPDLLRPKRQQRRPSRRDPGVISEAEILAEGLRLDETLHEYRDGCVVVEGRVYDDEDEEAVWRREEAAHAALVARERRESVLGQLGMDADDVREGLEGVTRPRRTRRPRRAYTPEQLVDALLG